MVLSRSAALLLGVSLLSLGTAPLRAQAQETGVTTLDTINLTSSADSSVQADGYVGSYSQAATKSGTPVAETQQSVSVVTHQQIEDQGAQTLGQALNYSAGVSGVPFGGDPRYDSPIVRGFDASTAQYFNGLRQLRGTGAPAYETYGLQQIEVLKGPSSSLYGAGSPAGIINQVQKRAQDLSFGEVGLGFDSNDSLQAFFDVNEALDDQLAYRITGIARDDHQQVDHVGNERGYLAGALRYRPDDVTTIDVMGSYTKDSPISPTGIPYALTQSGNGRDLRDVNAGEPGWDESDRTMYNFGVELNRQLDNGWALTQGFRYESVDWDYRQTYLNTFGGVGGLSADGTQLFRGNDDQSEETTGINLDTRFAGQVTTGALTHDLLFGVDLRKFDADADILFYTGSNLTWANGAGGGPIGAPTYISNYSITQTQVGVYAQDEISFGNWRGAFALRHDWSEQTGNKEDNFYGAREVDQRDTALTGRAGLGYQFANGFMPYVAYSTSFDPQIGTDIDTGQAVEATEAKQWELGVKYVPTAFNGLITASVYDLTQENVAEFQGGDNYRVIGEVKSKGLELEATVELNDAWSLRAGYAYNETEQVGGSEDGEAMPIAPQNLASLWLDHDFANGMRVGGGLRYIGERDATANQRLDDVTLVDLAAGYTRGNYEASLNIMNLTDEVYLANCTAFGCFYGEGRTVLAKVTYKW